LLRQEIGPEEMASRLESLAEEIRLDDSVIKMVVEE